MSTPLHITTMVYELRLSTNTLLQWSTAHSVCTLNWRELHSYTKTQENFILLILIVDGCSKNGLILLTPNCWKIVGNLATIRKVGRSTEAGASWQGQRFINNFRNADEEISARHTGDIIGQLYLVILRH